MSKEEKQTDDKSKVEKVAVENDVSGNKEEKLKMKVKKTKSDVNIWVKDIILGIINVGLIIGLVIILSRLPVRANQVKSLRSSALLKSGQGESELLKFDLENNDEKRKKLEKVFVNDERRLDFLDALEKLKSDGVLLKYTFESSNPVKDKTKQIGLPIILDMRGTWQEIDSAVLEIQNLPVMFRPFLFDVEESPEEGVIYVQYKGILYVDKSLEKN